MNGAITTEFDPDAEPEKQAALLPEHQAAYAVDRRRARPSPAREPP